MPDLPSGTVTFLFSDLEGSTRLLERLGTRYAGALGEHQALLRQAWADHGGVEIVAEGDSFFVAFPAAPAAVAAAAQAVRGLAAHPWPADAAFRARIGLHTGAPTLAGDNYVGLDVHRAARIAAAGHGGQILLSEATRALVEPALPDGAALRDLGEHRLKDLQRPERLCQLVLPGLPADFPPLKTLDRRPHNLPIQPTPLVGREEAVAAVSSLLRRDDARLVTLTGPGGIGKTRLGLQVAAELADELADGVWFVRLARVGDPALVLPTVAQALDLRESGDQPIENVLRAHLRDRRLLLVLDNFEQVIAAAPSMADLLETSPGLKLLVTSRVPLHLRGEREYLLAPLALPPNARRGRRAAPERLAQYAAVALFIERAQAARFDFQVSAETAPAIAEICARLDGLPLAIELAAARVKLLSPPALLARLSSRLKLLTGGARDLPERQQTLRNTIAWSYDLLAPDEQVLFRRLAIFAGGATFEAVEAVCAAPPGAEPLAQDVLDGLGSLVDKSLALGHEEGDEPRFGMLQVIREYGLERLEAAGASAPPLLGKDPGDTLVAPGRRPKLTASRPEAGALHRAHADFFMAFAERAQSELHTATQIRWLERLELEHDNLREALAWARASGEIEPALRLAGALSRFWLQRGYLSEGRAWLEGVLDQPGADAAGDCARGRGLHAAGLLALWQGDFAIAQARLEAGLTLARAADDRGTAAATLNELGIVAMHQGSPDRAAEHFEASLALARAAGDTWNASRAVNNLGEVAYYAGDWAEAEARYEESLAHTRTLNDREGMAVALTNLARMAGRRGDPQRAEALVRQAMRLDRDRADPLRTAESIEYLSTTMAPDQGEQAARLLGAAAALRETIGAPQNPQERADMEVAVTAIRTALGEETWAAAFAAGRALPLEEALAEALGEAPDQET